MKQYAVIVTSLVMLGGALQTPGFAQTGAGSSGSPGTSGAGASQSGTSGTSSSGAGQSPSGSLDSSTSGQQGKALSDPSGAQSGQQQQVGAITIQGSVSSETEKQAIESQLKQLPGVTSVNNMLKVASEGSISDPSGAQGGTPGSGTSGGTSSGTSGGTSSSPDTQPSTP